MLCTSVPDEEQAAKAVYREHAVLTQQYLMHRVPGKPDIASPKKIHKPLTSSALRIFPLLLIAAEMCPSLAFKETTKSQLFILAFINC